MRIVMRVLIALAVLLALAVAGVVAIGTFVSPATHAPTPAGMPRNEAVYVTMRDGVRIAVDLWYPSGLAAGERVPTLFRATRYVRATRPGVVGRALAALGRLPMDTADVSAFNDAGYVVALIDARGSGASFGTRPVDWSHDERRDFGELADWVARRPWSNGRVGAWGVSYDGNTAELFATTGSSAVRAVAPLFDDFDPTLNLVMPGGVLTKGFLKPWGDATSAMDDNDFCRLAGATGMKCALQRLMLEGSKPVDADAGGRMRDSAVAGHEANYDVFAEVSALVFPRDTMRTLGEPMSAVSPFALGEQLERGAVPMLVRVGWLDAATVNVALGRYFSVNMPQRLEIGPWSHGGANHVDPFLPELTLTDPPVGEQHRQLVDFFDGQLKATPAAEITREIRYYVMNGGGWRTTSQWPPEAMETVRWYLAEEGGLSRVAPRKEGEDPYTVDTTHTTGATTRWHTQLGGRDVVYADRAAEDRKLLTYTSAPLATDAEITGVPVVSLQVASTHDDGSFHVYLEDVAPDGRVTYVTEGIFRAINRRVSAEAPPYRVFGPHHSYRREDAMPLVPGEVAELAFELQATSVRIRAGHRIRLALAGADRAMFDPVPAGATPTWRVRRGGAGSSYLSLPMQAH